MLSATLVAAALAALGYAWAPDRPLDTLVAEWAPPPSTFRDIDGVITHLRDEGPRDDSLPLLLLHGTSASLHTWDGWTASLRDSRRVLRLDLPGFGLTGQFADGDYSVARYVRWLDAALDTLGVPRVIAAGNSFGGELAWALAAAHPERVAALVLVDAAGYPLGADRQEPIGFRLARMPLARELVARFTPRSVIASSLRSVYGDPARVTDALVDRYRAMTLREGNRRALIARTAQWSTRPDTSAIASIKAPTLILWGEQDRLITPRHAERFARDIVGSTVVRFPTLGHVPHEEDPVTSVAPVHEFLRRIAPPGATATGESNTPRR